MALPATDAFTAANGTVLTTYSASWTNNNGTFAINTNSVHPNSGVADDAAAHWNADVFSNDQYSQGTIVALGATIYIGVSVRCHASAFTFYQFNSDSADGCYLDKYVAGVYTQLGSTGGVFAVSDVIYLQASGTTLTPKKNGSTVVTPGAQTDSAITSGSAGIGGAGNGSTSRLDSWEGGNLGGATTASPPILHRAYRMWKKRR